MSAQKLLYVELDCPKCALAYGVAPCMATDPVKCKNTAATCKDIVNYDDSEIQTVRWVKSASYIPSTPYAVPNLVSVTTSSQRINPAENLGKRERVTCSFSNHRHNDSDLDPYVSTRPYVAYEQGTYWGKFAAMYPNVQGYAMRVIDTDTDGNEIISHYIADVGAIVGDKTGYGLTGKDVLDFAEGNKTLCPTPSNGILASAITNVSTSLTLSPSGIGAEYPASFEGYIGEEWVECTRSGDVVTLVTRGMFGTTAVEHDQDDTLQVAEVFTAQNVSQILDRLLQYTNTPAEYYNNVQWDQQVTIVNSPALTARIGQPTPVFELIQDLMRDMALDIHTDVIAKKVMMNFLINQIVTMDVNDGNIIDTPQAKYYEDKRTDLFLFSFGRKNPLLKMDEPSNYPATIVRPSNNPVVVALGNPPAIRRHYSRWVSGLLRPQASQTTAFVVGRYEFAPRGLMCKMKADMAPSLSQVVSVRTNVFEDAYGDTPAITMQVVSASRGQAHTVLELEEFRAAPFDPDELLIIISLSDDMLNMDTFNDLRELYDSVYPLAIPVGATVRFEAAPGVVLGGDRAYPSDFAVVVGAWPEVTAGDAFIEIAGLTCVGYGGNGGHGGASTSDPAGYRNGGNGGNALYTRVNVTLIDCIIGGGGGGGAGGWPFYGGGGGAGYDFGLGGSFNVGGGPPFGSNGTVLSGGAGDGLGKNGGDLGVDGDDSYPSGPPPPGFGGTAGIAIDGDSYITTSGTTAVYGSRIN
jgi:hypothetical protein